MVTENSSLLPKKITLRLGHILDLLVHNDILPHLIYCTLNTSCWLHYKSLSSAEIENRFLQEVICAVVPLMKSDFGLIMVIVHQ